MDNLYSSFYLYKKYEIIGDELIDLGITSIDADGTQEPVVKEECDPECGCPEPIYRWVQTEDTVCVGEEPAVQYRWTACGTTCDNANKYQNNIKEQSLDEGLTWTVVIPEEYSASTLVQQDSYDCGYRTGTTSSSTYCNGDDLYVDVYYRTSRDSGTTWTTASTTPTLVEAGGCATPASPKFTLTLSDSSIVSAECDSTSAITSGEVATQYSGTVVSAEIGECVSSIGNGAFRNCTGLTSVTIEDGVETIGEYAFYSCKSLTSITLPESAVISGGNTFENCSALTSVNIPTATTSIGLQTFRNCYSLTSVTIPSSVTHIGSMAFRNCSGLTSVTVLATTPPTLDSTNAFSGTNDFPIYVPCESVSAYQAATNWSSYASRIEGIPPCGQPTFDGKYKLTLNDSSTVSAECDSTSAITSNETSAYSASVTSAVIGDCVTEIGSYAFRSCTGLTSILIPDSVVSIGQYTFRDCYSLSSVTIGTGVTSIGRSAFMYCTSLTGITIPDSVTSIGSSAFYACNGLTSVTIPNSVTSIGNITFAYSTGLTSCSIGTGVTSIGESVFEGCTSLTSITMSDNVTSIGQQAFSHCYGLSSVTIPNSVTSIGLSAFYECSGLTSVIIPSGVTSIGLQAFYNCTSLAAVVVEATTPPSLGNNVFFGTNNCPLYVPAASLTDYQTAWSTYASRIQAIP